MSALPQREALLAFLAAVHVTGAGSLHDCLRHIEFEAAADPRIGQLLARWHSEAAEELSGPAPAFDEPAARWAAAILFRAAWLYLNRDATEAEAAALLSVLLPVPVTASSLFSADLTLRRLPDVQRMALALAPGDPLLVQLQAIAAAHPLSCAAMPPEEGRERHPAAPAWNVMRAHPGLWRLFIDRVIAARARWWLHVPDVREAVRTAAGAYAGDLVPAFDLSEPAPLTA